MDNTDILFASLVGSKIVEMIPRLTSVQNELMKHVLPVIPFLPFRNTENVPKRKGGALESTTWTEDGVLSQEQQFFPLSMSIDDGKNWFRLPYEPLISISRKNINIKRNVAKYNTETSSQLTGTIKERWSQDDYDITITGVLMGSVMTGNVEDCFPKTDFEALLKIMNNAKQIKVACAPFELLGINQIVIDDFSFPFTKGENVQAYEMKCCSDFSYNLLLPL